MTKQQNTNPEPEQQPEDKPEQQPEEKPAQPERRTACEDPEHPLHHLRDA